VRAQERRQSNSHRIASERLGASVRQSGHAVADVASQPVMQALSDHPVATGDIGDGGSVQDLEHCLVLRAALGADVVAAVGTVP